MINTTRWTLAVAALSLILGMNTLGCTQGMDPEKRRAKAEFHYKLANTSFYDNKIVPALRDLTVCLEHEPNHPDAHHLMGFIFFGRREHAAAERHFRKALSLRKGFHEARANLGALLLATKRWREAIDVLKPLQDQTLYATPWLVHNNVGFAYHQLRKRSLALKHYRLAVFHNPKFCLGYNNLGALYKELGQEDMAIDYLTRATSRCKRYSEPHFHLGMIYQTQGRARDARREFGSCVTDAPESNFARRCRLRM